jgi:hypothetical protein
MCSPVSPLVVCLNRVVCHRNCGHCLQLNYYAHKSATIFVRPFHSCAPLPLTAVLPAFRLMRPGYGSVDAKAGHTLYTEYQQAPRAKIYRRDQGKVADLSSMQYMMRFVACVSCVLFVLCVCVCGGHTTRPIGRADKLFYQTPPPLLS